MHDVACQFVRAAVRSKDAQKQLARNVLKILFYWLSLKCFSPFRGTHYLLSIIIIIINFFFGGGGGGAV